MSFDEALLVPEAKSPLSMRAIRKARKAASSATPAPLMPPPRMSRSNGLSRNALTSRFMGANPQFAQIERMGQLSNEIKFALPPHAKIDTPCSLGLA